MRANILRGSRLVPVNSTPTTPRAAWIPADAPRRHGFNSARTLELRRRDRSCVNRSLRVSVARRAASVPARNTRETRLSGYRSDFIERNLINCALSFRRILLDRPRIDALCFGRSSRYLRILFVEYIARSVLSIQHSLQSSSYEYSFRGAPIRDE